MRRIATWLVAAMLVVACTGPRASFGSTPTTSTVPGMPAVSLVRGPFRSVVVVGDSIAKASTTALTTMFDSVGITDVHIDGEVGRRIEVGDGNGVATSGLRVLQALQTMKVNPDVWVVELGTNDVGSVSKPAQIGPLIDEVLALIPANAPLVWVNTYREQYLDATKVFNLVLQQRLDARGHAAVADWFSIASQPNEVVLREDHIHPNSNGTQVIALLVAQALQRL